MEEVICLQYIDVKNVAQDWGVSERSVRNYCESGRVTGAVREGKSWKIPVGAEKPTRKKRVTEAPHDLLSRVKMEKEAGVPGGMYHKIQIEFTYNSNHIEGSRLTHDQTRYIYETNTIGFKDETINVDDIVETANHFRCIDLVIDQANYAISESFVKQLHFILKTGTSDSRRSWFAVGDYKRLENEVGGSETTKPQDVAKEIKQLLAEYNQTKEKSLEEIIDFHYRFERIHPFQDGNGRVGRLIMFKECLRNGITPFIIEDDVKEFYYRGLKEWKNERGYLLETCLTCQDRFKKYMDYFGLEYRD
jgi:Fic family protein